MLKVKAGGMEFPARMKIWQVKEVPVPMAKMELIADVAEQRLEIQMELLESGNRPPERRIEGPGQGRAGPEEAVARPVLARRSRLAGLARSLTRGPRPFFCRPALRAGAGRRVVVCPIPGGLP